MTLRYLFVIVSLCAGCGYRVVSPPARSMPLETASTIAKDRFGGDGEGGFASQVFGPDLGAGTARLRYGLSEEVELDGELGGIYVAPNGSGTHPLIYQARGGVKYQFVRSLALIGGLGGGISAGGRFISPDAGLVAAWENPYFVPFVSLHGFLSQPIGPREVFLGTDDDGGEHWDTPRFTYGTRLSGGFRIPLYDRQEIDSIAVGLHMVDLHDNDDQEDLRFVGVSAGVQLGL